MMLAPGGIDVFYIDESGDTDIFVITSVAVPLLREVEKRWTFVWDDYLRAYKEFRSELRTTHGVPARKELHASKLVSGRGQYRHGRYQFGKKPAAAVYRWILQHLDFLLKGH